jgi:hypothetical protein
MSGFSADWLARRELTRSARAFENVSLPARNNTLQMAFMLQSLGPGKPSNVEIAAACVCVEDEWYLEGKLARRARADRG